MKALPQLFVRRYQDGNPNPYVLLDLYDTDPIKMNLRVQDVMDPTITAASYSQTFRIPHSSTNGKFFKQAFNVNQTLFDPAVKAQAYINNQGQLWMMGVIQLMNVYREDATGKIEYEILFVSEVSDFATQIGLSSGGATGANQGGFLTNLNLAKYNHELNYNNIVLSWTQGFGGTGGLTGDVVYPLCEWGYNYTGAGTGAFPTIPTMATTGSFGATGSKPFCDPNFPLFQGQMKPALRVKAIWDAIFDRTEYTYESEFIQGNDYVSPSGITGSSYGDEFKHLYIISDKYARATLYDAGFTGGTGAVENVNTQLTTNFYYQYPNYSQRINPLNTVFDFANNFNVSSQVFTISVPGTYEFTFTADYDWLDLNYVPDGSEMFIFALSTVGGNSVYASGVDFFAPTSPSGSLNAIAVFSFATGDTIQFYSNIIVSSANPSSVQFYNLKITTTQTPTNVLDITAVLPDNIKQIDFIRSLNERFKLVFEPSRTQPKHFIITPWNDWIKQGGVRNWTDKLNNKKDYKLTPLFQSQPRFVTYKDQEDNDYVNYNYQQATKQVYGQLNQDSQIEIIKGTQEVQGIFAPLPLAPIGYGAGASDADVLAAETFLIPHIAKNTPVNDGPTKREPTQPKLRLAYYNQLCGSGGPTTTISKSWYLRNDAGTAIEQDKVPLMSGYYPDPWTNQNSLLDWNNSTVYWNNTLAPNPNGFSNNTNFQRFWENWYNATYGQIIEVPSPNGGMIQIRDYAYSFEGEFVLDYADIVDLRFNDLIWIKDAYYLVNSINDYVIGQTSPCKVVLYKIGNIDLAIPIPNQIVGGICYSSESICNAVCCQEFSPITSIFVPDPDNIIVGTRFFLNPAGSIFAPTGFYSDGTFVYTVVNSVVTVIDTIASSPPLCVCIPELDPLELCYIGATGDACLACCCQGPTGEFWMQDNDPATWYNNTVFYASSTGSSFPVDGWYAYDNTNYVYINNGIRTQSGSCDICNCLIYDLTQYVGCTGSTLCDASCCVNALNFNFFADSNDLNTATVLFSDQSGTPVPDGFYYNGLAAVEILGGTGAVNATGDPGSCEPCANETLDVFFDFNSNVNGTGSFAITRSFDGLNFMPESTKDLSTIPSLTPFNYTGPISPGTYVKGTLVYGASHETGLFNTSIEGGSGLDSQNTVAFSTYTYAPATPSTGGTEYRFSVNLTGSILDCALTGGTAWKCTPPSCNITGGTGGNSVYVYDNDIEVCCDPLYILEDGFAVVEEFVNVFINPNCTGGTGGICYVCDDFVSDTYGGNDFHIYENYFICDDLGVANITFNYSALDRPNRFSLYNSSGLIATSGWVGFATYPGPWGASLNTPDSGSVGSPYSNGMYLVVEAGPADSLSPISDTWQGSFVCT